MRVYPCQYSIDLGVVVRRWLTTANPVMMGSRQLPSENHDCFKCDSWMKSLYVFVLVKPCFWPCVFGCLTYIEAGTHPLVQYIYIYICLQMMLQNARPLTQIATTRMEVWPWRSLAGSTICRIRVKT